MILGPTNGLLIHSPFITTRGGGGVAPLSVYMALDLAGTVDETMTPAVLEEGKKGAVPGTWSRGAGNHGGVQSDPVAALTHTVVGGITSYDLARPIICNGTTITSVTRSIRNNQALAGASADWELVKWTPGEVIAENFLACFCYECNRSLGADTGGLSIDVVLLAFGGNGAIFQVQMSAGGALTARVHGGQTIPLSNNVRYRVELLCDLTGQRVDLCVKNDATGAFVGSCGLIYVDGVSLAYAAVGDYLINGDGTQDVSGFFGQKGAAAVFSAFSLAAVTGLVFVQNGIGQGVVSFDSPGLSFLIQRSDDGGAFVTIEANYYSPRSSINDPVEYTDTTLVDGTSVVYRVTAKVRQVTSATALSEAVLIDDAAQPFIQDNFDSYTGTIALGGQGSWLEVGGGVAVTKPSTDGYITGANGSVGLCYRNTAISANMRAECTIQAVGAGGNFDLVGPAVRIQAGANTGYAALFSGGDLYLISVSAGTATTIMSDTAMTLVAGDKIAIEVAGVGAAARLKVQVDTGSGWVDKWTDVNPVTDIDGGFAGVGSWVFSGPNALDNWKAFEL